MQFRTDSVGRSRPPATSGAVGGFSRAEAWRAALLGISQEQLDRKYVPGLRASKGNAAALRDEAARQYEYVNRALESLDNKAGVTLAGAVALLTLATTLNGRVFVLWAVGVAAFLAGVLSSSALAPAVVRGMSTERAAKRYGTLPPAAFALQVASQYADAVASAELSMRVKVIRLRVALVLLFLAATLLALR